MALRLLLLCFALTGVGAQLPPACEQITKEPGFAAEMEKIRIPEYTQSIQDCQLPYIAQLPGGACTNLDTHDPNMYWCENPACVAHTKEIAAKLNKECLSSTYPTFSKLYACMQEHLCDDDVSITAMMAIASPQIMEMIVQASATDDIKIDWKTLTDFTATFAVDAKNVNALLAEQGINGAVTSSTGRGTIQADVIGEKLSIQGHGDTTLAAALPPNFPLPMLAGNTVTGDNAFAFDGAAGWAAIRAKASAQPSGFQIEYCVKIKVPAGLLPPPQMMEEKLKTLESQKMPTLPPHKDVEIDGTSVALFEKSAPGAPTEYVGLRHDGSPFGAGIVAPSNGHWTPYIKFPTWKQGAGTITEFTCSPTASTSAVELINDPQAAQILAGFDKLVASLRDTESMSVVLASFPHKPSLLFQDAAATELNAAKQTAVQEASSQPWSTVTVAGAAGAIGALVALATMARCTRTTTQRKSLLSNLV